MAEPTNMILPMLREMRAENEARHGETLTRFDRIEQRLTKLESTQVSFRHALSADLLLSKLVTGDFQERIEVLEKWVQDQEDRAS